MFGSDSTLYYYKINDTLLSENVCSRDLEHSYLKSKAPIVSGSLMITFRSNEDRIEKMDQEYAVVVLAIP